MRKVVSVFLFVLAGLFFYIVCLLGFINSTAVGAKWGILLGFMIPAFLALLSGLALKGFRDWKRSAGVVLLSSGGFTAFLILTFVSIIMTEEFRAMMKPDVLAFFSDYSTGGGVIVSLAVAGLLLIKTNNLGIGQRAPRKP